VFRRAVPGDLPRGRCAVISGLILLCIYHTATRRRSLLLQLLLLMRGVALKRCNMVSPRWHQMNKARGRHLARDNQCKCARAGGTAVIDATDRRPRRTG